MSENLANVTLINKTKILNKVDLHPFTYRTAKMNKDDLLFCISPSQMREDVASNIGLYFSRVKRKQIKLIYRAFLNCENIFFEVENIKNSPFIIYDFKQYTWRQLEKVAKLEILAEKEQPRC